MDVTAFLALQIDLQREMTTSISNFLSAKNLRFDLQSFNRQASTDIHHMTLEVLTLGADVWPGEFSDDDPILAAA